jgi:cytochrome c-type biogenesis protein CcmH/NrfG
VTYLEQVFTENAGPPGPHASLDEVRAYVEKNPKTPLAWQMLARRYLWAENIQEARNAYQRLIELDPEWMANHEYDRENWEKVRAAV